MKIHKWGTDSYSDDCINSRFTVGATRAKHVPVGFTCLILIIEGPITPGCHITMPLQGRSIERPYGLHPMSHQPIDDQNKALPQRIPLNTYP